MSTQANHARKGYLMMAVLWFAYATFAMNWVAGSSLTPQITAHFFGDRTVDPLISQLVNYSITTARVFANILAALILMKLGPKKAPMLALFFLMMAIVAIICRTTGPIRRHGWSWGSAARWSSST